MRFSGISMIGHVGKYLDHQTTQKGMAFTPQFWAPTRRTRLGQFEGPDSVTKSRGYSAFGAPVWWVRISHLNWDLSAAKPSASTRSESHMTRSLGDPVCGVLPPRLDRRTEDAKWLVPVMVRTIDAPTGAAFGLLGVEFSVQKGLPWGRL